jgi:hypothetical protein
MEGWGKGESRRMGAWKGGWGEERMEDWKAPPFPIQTLKAVLGLEGGGPECVSQPAAGGNSRPHLTGVPKKLGGEALVPSG